jgi:hypothetical protein
MVDEKIDNDIEMHLCCGPFLKVLRMCRSNTDRIAGCGMSRATSEATGCRHRATTCFVLPHQLPGQKANKQQSTNTPTLLALVMTMAMRRYNTACIS